MKSNEAGAVMKYIFRVIACFCLALSSLAYGDYAGSILGNKEDVKRGLEAREGKPLKTVDYSSYAGKTIPTKYCGGIPIYTSSYPSTLVPLGSSWGLRRPTASHGEMKLLASTAS